MKSDIYVIVADSGKLHRPTCAKAARYYDSSLRAPKQGTQRVDVADLNAFEALPYDAKAYCCLAGYPEYVYRAILRDQSPHDEAMYQHAQDLLRSGAGFTATVQGLANAYRETTDEGRALLRPALSEALMTLQGVIGRRALGPYEHDDDPRPR